MLTKEEFIYHKDIYLLFLSRSLHGTQKLYCGYFEFLKSTLNEFFLEN